VKLKLGAQVAALVVVVGLLGLLVWKLVNQDQKQAHKNEPAPNFTLPRLHGNGELSLASLKGKAVVLNFWASWCGPCRDEVPVLERAWDRYRKHGVVVLGIDQQDVTGDARAFAKKYGVTYPLVRDGPGKVVATYGLTGVPETFFVGRSGKLVEHVAGQVNAEQVAQGIEAAMRS